MVSDEVKPSSVEDLKVGGLIVTDEAKEKLKAAFAFAIDIGKLDNLMAMLERLASDRYGARHRRCTLYLDSAPYSFYWIEEVYVSQVKEWKRGMVGGLIYHGLLPNGTKAETFTVSLTETDGWTLHT